LLAGEGLAGRAATELLALGDLLCLGNLEAAALLLCERVAASIAAARKRLSPLAG
jgi:hypothetical protein